MFAVGSPPSEPRSADFDMARPCFLRLHWARARWAVMRVPEARSSGNSEALACTAYYVSRDAGSGLGLTIRCASTSYKSEIRSNLHHANGRISGEWEERSFNAAGAASGVVSSERIHLQISGAINLLSGMS